MDSQFDNEPLDAAATIPDARTPSVVLRFLYTAAAFSVLGAIFAGISSADFISHLDRQVHSIHCSVLPGAGATIGESGCRTAMMSPYSSLFRTSIWGGLPISLLALAVYSYMSIRIFLFARRKQVTRTETGFLVVGTALPFLMSIIYGTISVVEVGAICNVCAAIYVVSLVMFVSVILAHRNTERRPSVFSQKSSYTTWFLQGCAYVAGIVFVYFMFAPQSDKVNEGCGKLVKTKARKGVLIPYADNKTGADAITVLDPLCPACRAFEDRLKISGMQERLNLRVLLFPLDSSCNWMVDQALHPGACAVSEAILCAPDDIEKIMSWAFSKQEALMELAKEDEKSLRALLKKEFPQTKSCLGSSKVRSRLNKSLRWAVSNAIPVLTPQLFVRNKRVCDEDTDLGLEFTLAQMLSAGDQ